MSDIMKKALTFLGLVEEYEDRPHGGVPEEFGARPVEAPPPRPELSNVRRISGETEPALDPEPVGPVAPPQPQPRSAVRTITQRSVHVTNPTTFNEVEEVGERFRGGTPVIMSLQGAPEAVAKRLLDFASGLIFGLDGRIERVGDRVFLLTPSGVDVSTEERARLSERGFFNQG